MTKKMLIIPGAFVPYNDTVTLLTYKRLKHLDIKLDVLALKGEEDAGLLKELESDPDYQKFSIEYCSNYDSTICLKHPLRLPIALFNMYRYIQKSLKKFEDGQYDYLYTSSIPGISHLCGRKIKEKHPEVKWYASFSDPIKGSPYKNDPAIKKRNIFYQLAFHIGSFIYMNNKYEEAALDHADQLIFICAEQRDFTLSQYPYSEEIKNKSIILPLSYIEDWSIYNDLINCKPVNNKPKKAVHLGRLYGLRRIDTFLLALKELKEEDKFLKDKIVFHQYSEIQREDLTYIKDNDLSDVFIIHDKVSYQKSLEIMQESNILVLFDTLMLDAEIQPYLPSKIVEYLLLKRDVLAICGDNSPAYRILKEYGYKTIGYTKDDIKDNIKYLIENNNTFDYSLDSLKSQNNCLKID